MIREGANSHCDKGKSGHNAMTRKGGGIDYKNKVSVLDSTGGGINHLSGVKGETVHFNDQKDLVMGILG